MKHLLALVVPCLLAVACGSSSPTAPSAPSQTTATLTSVTLAATVPSFVAQGTTIPIVATGTFSNGSAQNVTANCTNWKADNTFVLDVTSAGVLTAFNSGASTVTTTCQGVFASHLFNITVRPSQLFTQSGTGNNVINLPSYVARMHIIGTYGACCSNFVIWAGPANVNCDTTFSGSCSLLVNDLIGSVYGRTVSDGVYIATGAATLQIASSTGVAWSITEVR